MTPLDCALQRGFRSTTKYLQLHGGVPATRLGDIKQNPVTTGVSFQIKDDVTFWGDTSSDSERENGEVTKHSKRIQRKKISHKYEKKKASISGSDLENNKLLSGRSTKRRFGEKNQRAKTAGRTDSATSIDFPKQAARKTPSGRFDYNNEIVINGKTEINIHQTKEIRATPDEENLDKVPSKLSAEVTSEDRRPKSAKHAKVKEKSAGKEDSVRKKQKAERPSSKQKTEEKDERVKPEKKKFVDQQSVTSEEQEEQKSLIVEAAVHEPPKLEKTEKQEADKVSQTDIVEKESKIVQTLDFEKKEEEEESKIFEVFADKKIKVEENSEEEIDDKEQQENEIVEVTVDKEMKIEETSKTEKIVEVKRDVDSAGNKIKVEESAKTDVINDSQVEKSAVEEIESKEEVVTSEIQEEKLETKISETDESAQVEGNAVVETKKENAIEETKTKEAAEKSGVINEASDKRKDVEETAVITAKTVEEENEKLVEGKEDNSQKTLDKKEVDESEVPKEKENIPVEDKKKTDLSSESNKKQEKKTHKQKTKRKTERKKRQAGKDQAYEIIYKTMGADESDDETLEQLSDQDKTIKQTKREKLKPQKTISGSKSSEEEYSSASETESTTSTSLTTKEHKSFRILNDKEAEEIESVKGKPKKVACKQGKPRSRSEENKKIKNDKLKRSKIPTSLTKNQLSKSDKYLNIPDRKTKSSMESRVPSLPNINDRLKEHPRCESNMSAPLLESIYSDNEKASVSGEEDPSALRRKKVKKRSKTRESRSAGSDYESSNVIDSGFEPSPRSSRIPKWRNMSERGVNMTSVTQSIQSNIRRYIN